MGVVVEREYLEAWQKYLSLIDRSCHHDDPRRVQLTLWWNTAQTWLDREKT